MTDLDWSTATQAVKAAERILVVTHLAPDGDAIGSLLGMANALRAMGKAVDAAVDDGVPGFLKFVPGTDTVLSHLDEGAWDLMISVDASDEARTGVVGQYGRAHSKTIINLDHHATNTMFGDIQLVMPEAVSATEVVYRWLMAANFMLIREVAMPLLTGLVTDTLGFRTSNVSASTLAIAQKLMEAGASLTEITARTLDSKSFTEVNLWKQVLKSAELTPEGIISGVITQNDLHQVGMNEVADGGLVGFLVKVDEAMIAAVFKETPAGEIEISLRSKPGFDVSRVAFALGGGGHKQASGATIPGPLAEARSRVMPLLIEAVKQGTLVIA